MYWVMQIPAKNLWKTTHELLSLQELTVYSKSWIWNYYLLFHNFKFVATQLSLVGQFIKRVLLIQTGSIRQALIHVLTVPFKKLHSLCEAGLPFAHEMWEMYRLQTTLFLFQQWFVFVKHICFILTCSFSQKYSWVCSLWHTRFYLLQKIISDFGVLNDPVIFYMEHLLCKIRVKRNSVILHFHQSTKWVPYHCKNGCIILPLKYEISQLFLAFISSARVKVNFE